MSLLYRTKIIRHNNKVCIYKARYSQYICSNVLTITLNHAQKEQNIIIILNTTKCNASIQAHYEIEISNATIQASYAIIHVAYNSLTIDKCIQNAIC